MKSSSYVERLKTPGESAPETSTNKYFGFEPQSTGRALMIDLRTRDGRRAALPYSYLTRADFDPEKGIEIYVSNSVILVKGRELEDIYFYLLQNRLTWVREDDSGTDIGEDGVFVEGIEIKDRAEMESE